MTDDDKALVERLRQGHEGPAANRIEALSAENERKDAENERLRKALQLLHDNIVTAWPSLSELGPVVNARAALGEKL